MVRNLLTNAIKYMRDGEVLLDCRRQGSKLRIEVWDTGICILEAGLHAVFDEYHQLDNPARERSLGLSILRRMEAHLGISQRIMGAHRAAVMPRKSAKSLPKLARLAKVAAAGSGGGIHSWS